MTHRHRVVVVGGGFGGLHMSTPLDDAGPSTSRSSTAPTTTCSSPCCTRWRPAIMPPGLIAPAIRSVDQEAAQRARPAGRGQGPRPGEQGRPGPRPGRPPLDLPYDTLVVAAGATHSYFGKDEFAEFAPGMKTDRGRPLPPRRHPVQVRDGRDRHRPAGTGRMADLRGDRRRARPASNWPASSPSSRTRCCRRTTASVEHHRGADHPAGGRAGACCPRSTRSCSTTPRSTLEKMGVEIRRQHPGRRHGPRVHHRQGPQRGGDHPRPHPDLGRRRAGVTAGQDARREDRRRDRPGRPGRRSTRTAACPGIPRSSPSATWSRSNKLPGVAQPAMQEGKYVGQADQGPDRRRPGALPPFKYFDKGSMATIGHKAAVADAFGMKFTGFIAYLMWGFIHVAYLSAGATGSAPCTPGPRALVLQEPRPPHHHLRTGDRSA